MLTLDMPEALRTRVATTLTPLRTRSATMLTLLKTRGAAMTLPESLKTRGATSLKTRGAMMLLLHIPGLHKRNMRGAP